ncbi:UbiA family prenyltransferase, partial [Mycobacterium tuberculosis]|nr:UbiA family prenyltransferase [Mycobacterium tuberculosis]
ALVKCDDYAKARVPMLPVVAGPAATRLQILVYAAVLAPIAVAPWWLGFAGPVYGAVAAVVSIVFLALALRLWRLGDAPAGRRAALQLFAFSILHLFGLFATLLVERLVLLSGRF